MVVVEGRHDIAGNVFLSQRGGDGGGQADAVQRRIHAKHDPPHRQADVEAKRLRLFALKDQGDAFLLTERPERMGEGGGEDPRRRRSRRRCRFGCQGRDGARGASRGFCVFLWVLGTVCDRRETRVLNAALNDAKGGKRISRHTLGSGKFAPISDIAPSVRPTRKSAFVHHEQRRGAGGRPDIAIDRELWSLACYRRLPLRGVIRRPLAPKSFILSSEKTWLAADLAVSI